MRSAAFAIFVAFLVAGLAGIVSAQEPTANVRVEVRTGTDEPVVALEWFQIDPNAATHRLTGQVCQLDDEVASRHVLVLRPEEFEPSPPG